MTSIVFLSCDETTSILEGEQYQQKEYEFNPIDTLACEYLSDTLSTYIATGQEYNFPGTWTTESIIPNDNWIVFRDTQWVKVKENTWDINPTENWIIVPDSSYLPPTDSTWTAGSDTLTTVPEDWNLFGNQDQLATVRRDLITQIAGAITDSLLNKDTVTVESNMHNALLTPAETRENLVVFDNGALKDYVVYVNDFIDLKLFDSQGNEINTSYNQIPLVSTGGCMDAKVRQEYTLDPGNYLLQATKTEQTTSDTLHVVLLPDEEN